MKKITAFFEEDNYCKASGLWQYDYGQILSIEGLNLPKIVEIHFSLDDKNGSCRPVGESAGIRLRMLRSG